MAKTPHHTRTHVVSVSAEYILQIEVQEGGLLSPYESHEICSDVEDGVSPSWVNVQSELPRGARLVNIEVDCLAASVEGDG